MNSFSVTKYFLIKTIIFNSITYFKHTQSLSTEEIDTLTVSENFKLLSSLQCNLSNDLIDIQQYLKNFFSSTLKSEYNVTKPPFKCIALTIG